MILDRLNTNDGFDVFWVHDKDSTDKIYEDDLWSCEHNLHDWISQQIRDEDIDVEDITNYIEDTIDLVEIHKDILLESNMYVIKEDTDDFFRGMEEEEMIELARIKAPILSDSNYEEDFISILEDNGYEVEQ